MTVTDFINQVFLNEYKQLVKHHYVSFALIALGVEMLGACLDGYPFGEKNKSATRFKSAIGDLFPPSYCQHKDLLCDDLRNGFAHQFRPTSGLWLTNRAESAREGTKHLSLFKDRLILVAEDLYQDFEEACKKMTGMIAEGSLSHAKLSEPFLTVTL